MNICIFGDSITWGACDNEQSGWVARLRSSLANSHDETRVYNLGISGEVASELLARFEHEAKAREVDVIVFAIGINDAQFIHSTNSLRTDPGDFAMTVKHLYLAAKKLTNKIWFIGLTRVDETKTSPTPWNTNKSFLNRNIETLDSILQSFCTENNVSYLKMSDAVDKKDLADGLHPNAAGHEKMFKKVAAELEALDN